MCSSLLKSLGLAKLTDDEVFDTISSTVLKDAKGRIASNNGIDGIALHLFDGCSGQLLWKVDSGNISDRRLKLASASKLVSGIILCKLVSDGKLSFTSTTGQLLGWKGEKGSITLDQLGSMVSGLDRDDDSMYSTDISLAESVALIGSKKLVFPPGTRFDYKQTDWQVAGRMAEVSTSVVLLNI